MDQAAASTAATGVGGRARHLLQLLQLLLVLLREGQGGQRRAHRVASAGPRAPQLCLASDLLGAPAVRWRKPTMADMLLQVLLVEVLCVLRVLARGEAQHVAGASARGERRRSWPQQLRRACYAAAPGRWQIAV